MWRLIAYSRSAALFFIFNVSIIAFLRFGIPVSCCFGSVIWRNSLLAIWRKAWACRSWRSCRQRLGILRYHASSCLNHTLSSIDRRGRRGSSLSDGATVFGSYAK
jgi:hypothetical protein